jgi:hypothetical protein
MNRKEWSSPSRQAPKGENLAKKGVKIEFSLKNLGKKKSPGTIPNFFNINFLLFLQKNQFYTRKRHILKKISFLR